MITDQTTSETTVTTTSALTEKQITTSVPVTPVTTVKPVAETTSAVTTAPTTTTAPVDTSKWLSGIEHKPLQVNVQPNKLYWGTTSMTQMNNIESELNFLFTNKQAFGAGTNCTVIEFYYNRDWVGGVKTDKEFVTTPTPIPKERYICSKENLGFWISMAGCLSEYYSFGSSDGGKNDNAYIAYSTYIDPGFRTGANSNGDCGGRAQFDRSFLNYMGYETRYVTGRQYGTNHAGYQVRLQDGTIYTYAIKEANITTYGNWE